MPCLRLWFPNHPPLSSTKSPPLPASRASPVVPMSGRPLRLRLQRLRAENRRPLCGDSIAGRVHRAVQILASRTHRAALQALRVTALGEIAKGVETGNRFYTDDFESVFVLGPCEGDLGSVDYVKIAAKKSKRTCGSAISAQMYLQQCYITLKKQWQLSLENWPLSRKRPIPKYNMEDKDQ
nr:cysteine-rich repeat secretory protein 3 [Ipomoea trifida]